MQLLAHSDAYMSFFPSKIGTIRSRLNAAKQLIKKYVVMKTWINPKHEVSLDSLVFVIITLSMKQKLVLHLVCRGHVLINDILALRVWSAKRQDL